MVTTYLSSVIAKKPGDKCPDELLFGCIPKFNLSLKTLDASSKITESLTYLLCTLTIIPKMFLYVKP
jgi:hypothetical protein